MTFPGRGPRDIYIILKPYLASRHTNTNKATLMGKCERNGYNSDIHSLSYSNPPGEILHNPTADTHTMQLTTSQ